VDDIARIISDMADANNGVKLIKKKGRKPKSNHKETPRTRIGKIFEGEVSERIRYIEDNYKNRILLWGRFSDTNLFSHTLLCPVCHHKFSSKLIIPEQPADYWIVTKNNVYFIEAKSSASDRSFPLGNIKEHQLNAARALRNTNVVHYFFINDRRRPRHYKLSALTIIDVENILEDSGRKASLLWDDVMDYGIPIPRAKDRAGKTGMWYINRVIR